MTKCSTSVLKVGIVHMDVSTLECLKEELVLDTDKWLHIVSNTYIILLELKNKVVLSLKQFCMYCYVVLSNIM